MLAMLHNAAPGFLIGGAILAASGAFSYQAIYVKRKRATAKTSGSYIGEFQDSNAFAKSRAWIPLISYKVDGKKYKQECRYAEGINQRTPTPCTVDVYYDPYDPTVFCVVGPGSRHAALRLKLMIVIGLVFVLCGVVGYFL